MTVETIEKIKTYVQEHIGEKITNKKLGKIFAYCPQSLQNCFKKYEGIPLRQYIIKKQNAQSERVS